MTQDKPASAGWRVGQRVSREDSDELGTITQADGDLKVEWDSGRTSYFSRGQPANVKLAD